jgi:hypothetical protein
MSMSSLPTDIARLALLGWRLYPASRSSRAACLKGPTDQATCDLDQLGKWAREYPGCNWRVVFEGSLIWGLDVDVPGPDHAHDGMAALAALVRENGPLPPRPMTRSGGGGAALFFHHEGEEIIGKTGHPALGIDPRRGRQSVTVPPSIHHRTGRSYRWITPPWEVAAPPAPAWLLRMLRPPPVPSAPPYRSTMDTPDRRRCYALGALRHAIQRVAAAGDGGRNDTLNCETFSLRRYLKTGALYVEWVREGLLAGAARAGLPEAEARATIESAIRAGRGQ